MGKRNKPTPSNAVAGPCRRIRKISRTSSASSWHQENAERIARRLLLVQLAAACVYQLSLATDDKSIELRQTLASLGGWSGRKKDPIGPTMLVRGALLFLGAMQLIQLHSKQELFNIMLVFSCLPPGDLVVLGRGGGGGA